MFSEQFILFFQTEAAHQMCSYEKALWIFAADLQENTHAKKQYH